MVYARLFFSFFLLGSSLFAAATDKWKVEAGGMFVTNFDTDVRLSEKGVPVGAVINTKDQLGLETDTVSYRVDGYYRFNDHHRIEASYYGVRSNGNKVLNHDIDWDGETISAGATTDTYFDMDIFKINYAYSFYHNDRVELSLTAGLHVTAIALGLNAKGTINGVTNEIYSKDSSVTAPLPIFGFRGQYTIIPDTLFVQYAAQYFYLQFEVFQGSLVTNTMSLEYRFTDHIGAGAGFDSTLITVDMDDGGSHVNIENTLAGVLVYLSYTY